jgi:hypothetical protein
MEFLQSLAQLPELLIRLEAQLDANTKALGEARALLDNVEVYEPDAALYLNVGIKTMYHYRQKGLAHKKVGRVISYLRKDLDNWRSAGKVHA